MGVMPGWFAKLPELWRLDVFFSFADAGGPAGLKQRYQDVIDAIQNGRGIETALIDSSGNPLFDAATMAHFNEHWVRENAPDSFFPAVTHAAGYTGSQYLAMQADAFLMAMELGRGAEEEEVRPANFHWMCAPANVVCGAAVSHGPNGVTVVFVTPFYADPTFTPSYSIMTVPDRSWTWELGTPGPSNESVQLRADSPTGPRDAGYEDY